MNDEMDAFFSGRRLYGDDFEGAALRAWFEEEREGYAEVKLGSSPAEGASYPYHALNHHHGWRYLPRRRWEHVLGFGSALGLELSPLDGAIDRVSIVEPSERLRAATVAGVTPEYVTPEYTGLLPFEDGTFDLLTCLGVLHHVANVSVVLRELHRVARRDSYLLLREPIVTQGDWRDRRGALTKNERGIPLQLFRELVRDAGLAVERESLCVFPPSRLLRPVFGSTWNSGVVVRIDALASRATSWRYRYHLTTAHHRLQPTSVFYVLRKRP